MLDNLSFIDDMYCCRGSRDTTGFFKHYLTLFAIVEGLEAKRTFEFGTGLSTRVILEALQYTGGIHTSCDIRKITDTGLPKDFVDEYGHMWQYLQQNSQMLNRELLINSGPFDFVLHDGSHIVGEVRKDLQKILPLMKKNSILMIHDTYNDKYPGMSDTINTSVLKNIEHEKVTLPYSYGITIVRILEDFGNGTVTPTWKK